MPILYNLLSQLRKVLKNARGEIEKSAIESRIQTNDRVLCGFDDSSLFDDDNSVEDVEDYSLNQRFNRFWDRLRKVNRRVYNIRNTLEVGFAGSMLQAVFY